MKISIYNETGQQVGEHNIDRDEAEYMATALEYAKGMCETFDEEFPSCLNELLDAVTSYSIGGLL